MKILYRTFIPRAFQLFAVWLQNFNKQLQVVGASLGFTAPELLVANKDNQNIQFVAETLIELDAYAEAVREYRNQFLGADPSEPVPVFPADRTFTLPNPTQPPGLYTRLEANLERIFAASAYTPEIGALLGILTSSTDKPSPDTAKPEKLDVSAMPGNNLSVKFTRGQFDGIMVEMKIDNDAAWNDGGRYFKSPALPHIPASPDNLPRNVQVRIRYVLGNDPVGEWSDVVIIQTKP